MARRTFRSLGNNSAGVDLLTIRGGDFDCRWMTATMVSLELLKEAGLGRMLITSGNASIRVGRMGWLREESISGAGNAPFRQSRASIFDNSCLLHGERQQPISQLLYTGTVFPRIVFRVYEGSMFSVRWSHYDW